MTIRGKRKVVYKPKQVKEDDIEQGFNKLRNDMVKTRGQQVNRGQQVKIGKVEGQQQFNIPNIWQPKQVSQTPVANRPTRQTTLEESGMKVETDEPYWSAEQWEEWAYDLMTNYADQSMLPKEMMPDWFIQAVEEGDESR